MTDQTNKQNAGKSPVFQGCFAYFPRALKAVAMVSLYGKTKYKALWTKKGWLQVAEGDLLDAQCRHILDRVIEGDINHMDGKVLHQAQVAWEALAALEVSLLSMEAAPFINLDAEETVTIDAGKNASHHQFDDVMGDVMEARIIREKDEVSSLMPYKVSPASRYVVPGGFDLETKTNVYVKGETLNMSWYNFFALYVNPKHWPQGYKSALSRLCQRRQKPHHNPEGDEKCS